MSDFQAKYGLICYNYRLKPRQSNATMRQIESNRLNISARRDLGIGPLNAKLPILSYWYLACAILI